MLCTTPALAHTWDCPTQVRASGDGTFQFDVVLVIEGASVLNGGYSELGTNNVDGVNLVADGFCIAEMAPGTELRTTVRGTLTDAEQQGTVHINQFVCGIGEDPGTTWDRDVTILPAVVDTEAPSFGMIKARFAR